MSAHSVKARAHHPAPTTYERERFETGHVTWELIDHPEHGATFALIAGMALHDKDRRPLFSGHIEPGMADALQAVVDRVRELEPEARS